MANVTLQAPRGRMPAYVATPRGTGPWPVVVVIHDVFGVTTDLRRQADWLAASGFAAVAPDLYYWGRRTTCLFSFLRDQDGALADIDAARDWAVAQPWCSGRAGVIGFCLGGGFALALAPRHGYAAVSANYGRLPASVQAELGDACPVIGSYGGKDRSLRGVPERLDAALSTAGVPHEVTTYPDAGHGFLNDHDDTARPAALLAALRLTGAGYHEPSARTARARIVDFFALHLGARPAPSSDP